MSFIKFTRSAFALSLSLGLLAVPALAENEALDALETEATLSQQVALAPSVDRDDSLLPESKRESIAAVSVPEVAPKVARTVLPEYPSFAVKARLQGMVFARVLVDENGQVAKVGQVKGHALFQDAVKMAARQWQFTPARQGNKAVSTWVTVPFSFEL